MRTLTFLLLALLCRIACADAPPAPAYAAQLRRDVEAVYHGKDFHRIDTTYQLVPRDWLKRWLDRDRDTAARPRPLPNLSRLAIFLKYAIIAAILLTLPWLVRQGLHWLQPGRHPRGGRKGTEPAATTSTPLPASILPDDIAAAAHDAWQRGNHTGALSLLYRGAVQALDSRYGIALPASATEGECLRLARQKSGAAVEAFAAIVQAWQALAYAGLAPADFEALAGRYRQHFEGPLPETAR